MLIVSLNLNILKFRSLLVIQAVIIKSQLVLLLTLFLLALLLIPISKTSLDRCLCMVLWAVLRFTIVVSKILTTNACYQHVVLVLIMSHISFRSLLLVALIRSNNVIICSCKLFTPYLKWSTEIDPLGTFRIFNTYHSIASIRSLLLLAV